MFLHNCKWNLTMCIINFSLIVMSANENWLCIIDFLNFYTSPNENWLSSLSISPIFTIGRWKLTVNLFNFSQFYTSANKNCVYYWFSHIFAHLQFSYLQMKIDCVYYRFSCIFTHLQMKNHCLVFLHICKWKLTVYYQFSCIFTLLQLNLSRSHYCHWSVWMCIGCWVWALHNFMRQTSIVYTTVDWQNSQSGCFLSLSEFKYLLWNKMFKSLNYFLVL